MKKISIVIPIYNSERYLKRCIDSIVNQTYKNLEIILINDGSTDDSIKIIKNYQKKDNRIRIIDKSNTGVSDSRNMGIEMATGDFISFVDSDDTLDIHFFEHAIRFFDEEKVDIVCTNFNYDISGKIKQNKSFHSKKVLNYLALNPESRYYVTTVWAKIFKSEIVKNIKFDRNIYYSEDTLFYTESALQANYIYFLNEYLYNYYINNQGAMKNKDLKKYSTDLLARKKILDIYEQHKLSKNLIKNAKIYLLYSYVNIVFLAKQKCIELQLNFDDSIIFNYSLILSFVASRFIKFKDKIKLLYIVIRGD